MSPSGFIRFASSGPAVVAVTLGLIGFAVLIFGGDIVGEMRLSAPSP
jgi:hypothetical protein